MLVYTCKRKDAISLHSANLHRITDSNKDCEWMLELLNERLGWGGGVGESHLGGSVR